MPLKINQHLLPAMVAFSGFAATASEQAATKIAQRYLVTEETEAIAPSGQQPPEEGRSWVFPKKTSGKMWPAFRCILSSLS